MALKIKVGDTVRVIAGKDKDKEGKVLAVADGKVVYGERKNRKIVSVEAVAAN